ncbi:sigma-70 family RNA polymerase sigma factor [Streptomyces phaeochromogenes]|uniref:RNA polymerase sigma factor n=1 Tax=Streptomyces phaeochromogenes TaxID=1923 RepID=UPI00340A143D
MTDPDRPPERWAVLAQWDQVVDTKRRPQAPADSAARTEFASFYAGNKSRLVVFIMRHGADSHEAGEVVQAAFAQAWERWESIEHPHAWLRKVAYRQLLRSRDRRESPLEFLEDSPGGPCPVERVDLDAQEKLVLKVLADLPMQQRRVFAWTYDGFSTQETAELLDMAPESVRQNLARARKSLKRAWETMREDHRE